MTPIRRPTLASAVTAVALILAACAATPPPPSGVPSASGGLSASIPASPSATPALASPAAPSASPGATASAAVTPAPASPTTAPTATPVPTRAPTAPPPVDAFPQTWAGTWTDPVTGGAGSLELVLTGEGDAFGGSITMDGTACLANGILDGRYDGREIAFTVSQRDVDLAFVGQAADGGLRGTFTSTCEGMDGSWEVHRAGR
jgi:hypothetical protein